MIRLHAALPVAATILALASPTVAHPTVGGTVGGAVPSESWLQSPSGGTQLPGEEGAVGTLPTPTQPPPAIRKGLMAAGFGVFWSSYGLAMLEASMGWFAGTMDFFDPDTMLGSLSALDGRALMPVVGPMLVAWQSDGSQESRVKLAIYGAAQGAGLAMAIAGTALAIRDQARYDRWGRWHSSVLDDVSLSVYPSDTGNGNLIPTVGLSMPF